MPYPNMPPRTDAMEQAMATDRAPHQILGWTRLGLLEITRRRSRGALQALLSGGRSRALDHLVRSPESTGYDILRLARLEADNSQTGDIVIHAHRLVIDWLNDGRLATLAGLTSRTIEAEVDSEIETDEFDIYTE